MGWFIRSGAWQNRLHRQSNGFILVEAVLVFAFIGMIAASYGPLAVQTVRSCYIGERWEELSRQGMVLDETLYETLRFCQDVTVTDTSIRCRDEQGVQTGFRVKNGRVYRMMSNNSEQPLTGSGNANVAEDRIRVEAMHGEPYFSLIGHTIQIRLLLRDMRSQEIWTCVVTVVPLAYEWENIL